MNDGLTLWSVREDGDHATIYLGNPDHPGTECWTAPAGVLARLASVHNQQVEWSRTTLLAEKAAGRPTISAAEIEKALTRMAAAVAVEVAKQLGPIKVIRWVFGSLRRRAPRPPAVTPMPERPRPPAA